MSAVATTARPRRVTARAIEGQELVLLGVLAMLWLVLSFAVDTFFTASTLQDLMAAVAPVAIVGVGMTAIIVTGGIDVSVGSAVAVAMVVVGQLVRDSGLPFLPAVAVAVAWGATAVTPATWFATASTSCGSKSDGRGPPPPRPKP